VNRPLIVTAAFEPAVQMRLEALRKRYYPADRNVVGAHLTLFHALPAVLGPYLSALLRQATCAAQAPSARLTGLRRLGNGFAVDVAAPQLVLLHERLTDQLRPSLSRQDAQRFWPHVTVQNKVSAAQAEMDFVTAQDGFAPLDCALPALRLWRYEGGPWAHLGDYAFASRAP
jgi:2'-5' RNA ligase